MSKISKDLYLFVIALNNEILDNVMPRTKSTFFSIDKNVSNLRQR